MKMRKIAVMTIGVLGISLVANAGITSTSGDISLLTSPLASVMPGQNESNTEIPVFQESSGVLLSSDVSVDISSLGTYDTVISLTPGTIPAGTTVESYLIHFDSVGGGPARATGSIVFDQPILGVIVTGVNLSDSVSELGNSSTSYAPLGLEFVGNNAVPENLDTVWFVNDTEIAFDLGTTVLIDNVRVITAIPEPASMAMIGLVATGIFFKRRLFIA